MAVDASAGRVTTDTRRLRFDFVDGMRGVAALFVVFHHIWQFSISSATAPAPRWFGLASFLKYGDFAVVVFVVVSGYCLMLPVTASPDGRIRGGFKQFAMHRSRRILPPYAVALIASAVVIACAPRLRRPTGLPWDITLPHSRVGNIVSHVLLTHNWSLDWRWGLNPPLWTVALEFQIYLVFALVLMPIWRRAGLVVTIAVAFAVGLAPIALGRGFADPWMLGMFALGMASAVVATADDSRFPWRDRITAAPVVVTSVIAVLLVTAASGGIGSVTTQTLVRHLFVGIAAALALTAMTLHARSGRVPSVAARFLSWSPIRRLGWFSFSLYLIHYPIVALVTVSLRNRLSDEVPATFALLSAICLPASLLAALAFHVVVERRFLNTALSQRQAGSAVSAQDS